MDVGITRKLREILSGLQFALDVRKNEGDESPNVRQLAVLQIIYPPESQTEMAEKIVSGIGLPEGENCPLRIALNNETIPIGFAQINDLVYEEPFNFYRKDCMLRQKTFLATGRAVTL